MKEVYVKLIALDKDNLPITIEEGMQRVCDIDNYAFMTSLDVVLGLLDNITCEITSVLGASIPESLAMSVVERSPYLGLINYKWVPAPVSSEGKIYKPQSSGRCWPQAVTNPSNDHV
jgi:hypothetical protein